MSRWMKVFIHPSEALRSTGATVVITPTASEKQLAGGSERSPFLSSPADPRGNCSLYELHMATDCHPTTATQRPNVLPSNCARYRHTLVMEVCRPWTKTGYSQRAITKAGAVRDQVTTNLRLPFIPKSILQVHAEIDADHFGMDEPKVVQMSGPDIEMAEKIIHSRGQRIFSEVFSPTGRLVSTERRLSFCRIVTVDL